MKVDFS